MFEILLCTIYTIFLYNFTLFIIHAVFDICFRFNKHRTRYFPYHGPIFLPEHINYNDLFQPKISFTLSFSGIYWKAFIYCRKRTNSRWIALIYLSIGSIWLYVIFNLGNSIIRYICDIQNLNIISIISYFNIFPFFQALLPLHHKCYEFNHPTPYVWTLHIFF